MNTSTEKKAKIRELHEASTDVDDIADILKVQVGTVRSILGLGGAAKAAPQRKARRARARAAASDDVGERLGITEGLVTGVMDDLTTLAQGKLVNVHNGGKDPFVVELTDRGRRVRALLNTIADRE